LTVPDLPKDYSIEDGRCFVLGGKVHAAYVVSAQIDGHFRCYIAYGEIRDGQLGHIQVQYNGNDFSGQTKNLVPFVHDDMLYLIYGIKGNSQIVIHVDGKRVLAEHSSPGHTWA